MAICLSHGGTTTYSSPSPSHEVLVGTVGGVFTIQRENTKEWRISRRSLEGCHVSSLALEPSRGLAFAGLHKGSIYGSGDLGKTWEPKDKGLTEKDIYSLSWAETSGRVRLYAGTEPACLFLSDDLGERWHELESLRSVPSVPQWTFPAPPHTAHVKNIVVDPGNAKKIYVAIEVGALLKSEDGGGSWRELGKFDDAHRIVIRPSQPDWLYFSHGGQNYGIFCSRDGGESWKLLTPRPTRIGYPDPLLIHPHRESLMFMAGAASGPGTWRETRTANSGIARSRDGGESWEILQHGLPDPIRGSIEAMAMEVWNGSFALFAGTTDGEVFYSDDEGDHWMKIVDGLPPISKWGHYRILG